MALVYVGAQMIGATVGYAALQQLTPSRIWAQSTSNGGVCLTSLQSELTLLQGLIMEFLATCVLILLCCSCWDPRNKRWQDGIAIKFGLAITLLSFTVVCYAIWCGLTLHRGLNSFFLCFNALIWYCHRDHTRDAA